MSGGGRTFTFRYLPWGRHWDDKRRPDALNESIFTINRVANPTRVTDIGSGVAQSKQTVDVHVYWQDDEDLASPDAWFKAVEEAFTARVRQHEKGVTPAWFIQVINVLDAARLTGKGTSTVVHELILTCEAAIVDVYGA